ncbi:hypothetical protein VTN02DRAFT_3158 [Thermoascus thermophilus]
MATLQDSRGNDSVGPMEEGRRRLAARGFSEGRAASCSAAGPRNPHRPARGSASKSARRLTLLPFLTLTPGSSPPLASLDHPDLKLRVLDHLPARVSHPPSPPSADS